MIDRTQFANALQITLARIGQPILAFAIMQAFVQSQSGAPTLFPVLWGLTHTVFVFFMGLTISAQNHAVQAEGKTRLSIFAYIAARIVGVAALAALGCLTVAILVTGSWSWSLLLALYLASSALNAAHNTLHELAGRRGRSIAMNWVWIGAILLGIAAYGRGGIDPLTVVTALIAVRIAVVAASATSLLRSVAVTAEGADLRNRIRHGAEFGLNMAVETSAFPILTYSALLIAGAAASEEIYAFSVEANFLFISMTGIFQQATLHLGARLREVRGNPDAQDFLMRNLVHVVACAVLILCAGITVLAFIGAPRTPGYWALVYVAALVMTVQTLAVSWARVLDLTRMITLTALPSTFAIFVASTVLFLWAGVPPRAAITLGVVLDGGLVAILLLWLVRRALIDAPRPADPRTVRL